MRLRATLLTSALAAALLSFSGVSGAADAKVDPEVQKHFTVANKLYKEMKYADALVEYDEAYRLSGNYKVLYNRGQCLVMLKREPEAIATFERYLKDGGTDIDADRKKEVDQTLADLRERLGKIALVGAPAGAIIEVDGVVTVSSYSPGTPVLAGAGQHELVVRAPGGQGLPDIKQVKVKAGEVVSVTINLASPTVPVPANTYPAGAYPANAYPNGAQPVGQPVYGQPADTMYPQPAPLPVRPPGGLVSPSFMISLVLGGSAETGSSSSQSGGAHVLGAAELGASWRPGSFIELGLFFAGASGQHPLGNQNGGSSSNADYTYSNYGVRLRMHPIRGKSIDGWFGFDVGGFHESWHVSGSTSDYTPNGTAFAIALGADFPISRTWALGGVFRYLMTSGINADSSALCGSGCTPSGARGYLEFGLRVVWSIPYGQKEAPPAKGTASSAALPSNAFF